MENYRDQSDLEKLEDTLPMCSQCTSPATMSTSTTVKSSEEKTVRKQDYLDLSFDDKKQLFQRIWGAIVSDSRLDLFGFRRFRTVQLLNLRLLEEEMQQLHREVIRAGLKYGELPVLDRLGLQYERRNKTTMDFVDVISHQFVDHLRKTTKEYNEALLVFNTIMSMETFCLADNTSPSNPIKVENAQLRFKTRLMRADLPLRRSSRDPVQHFLRKCLRRLWHWWVVYKTAVKDEEHAGKKTNSIFNARMERLWGNTSRVAEVLTRFVIGLIAGSALVAPLVILSGQSTSQARLLVVIVSIILFCLVVSTLSKASHYESMAASAAYAAVLTVFLSNTPTS